MRKKKALALTVLIFLVGSSVCYLEAANRLDLKLRVYEGTRQGNLTPPKFVTSSYLQPTITANLQTEFDLDKEKAQVKRVFNLQDITLLTEADLVIGEGGQDPNTVRHFFRLDGSAYTIIVMIKDWKNPAEFLVLFNDVVADKPKNILTTEMSLMGGHSAVFGFENREGKPYFCSFHVTGPPEKIMPPPPPPPPPPPVPPELKKKIEEFEEGAVKAWNAVNPPRLLKIVDPVYPEAAEKEGLVEGGVKLNVRADEKGNVSRVMVVFSSNEIFNEPAITAVRQWKYEPYVENGNPKEVVFSVFLRFNKTEREIKK
jgi:TonB family protein